MSLTMACSKGDQMATVAYEGFGTVAINTQCPFCGAQHVVKCKQEEYDNWNSGMLIQDAMPNASADKRELLMTGICPTCFPTDTDE